MNKIMPWIMGVVITGMFAGAGSARAEGASACYIVKTMGFDRKIATEMMSEAEFKALEKNIKLEQRYFPKAVALVGKDWRADELNKKIPFPGNMLKPRNIMMAQKYPSSEKAVEQLTKLENMEAKKAEQESNSRGRGSASLKDPKKDANLAMAGGLVKIKLDILVANGGLEPGAAKPAEADAKGAK